MDRSLQGRWFNRLEFLILAAGIGLRLVRFLERRPLWLDEALIALNILTRPPQGYVHPLDSKQVAPLGFLWGEWLVTRLAGTGERALRFLPLVAAILALIAFARLARRILEPEMALLATALAAMSPLLIYYSAEVKPYGFDWLAAILLMHATLTLVDDPSPNAWKRWSLVAAFSVLVSIPAPFFIGGCALALLIAPEVRRRPRALFHLVAAGAPAALIFGVQLLTVYHSSSTTSFMQLYWTELFLEPHVASGLVRGANIAREFWASVLFAGGIVNALPPKTMTIIGVTSAVGAMAIVRRSVPMAIMLVVPAVLAGIASLGKWWPLTPRLLLFAAPAVLITLPAGLATLTRLAPRKVRMPVLAVLSLALIAAAAMGVPGAMPADRRFIAVPQALSEVATRVGPNAAVYVSADMEAACRYYLVWHPDRARLPGVSSSRGCALRGPRTVIGEWPWFVGLEPGRATNAPKVIQPEWLEREGRRILDQSATEVWVLIGNPDLRTPLPSWLEASGATRLAERETGGIRILQYRRN